MAKQVQIGGTVQGGASTASQADNNDWPELQKTGSDDQSASFRGVAFHVRQDSPEFSHAVAVYERPDRPGATVKDMARGAARYRLTAVFNGDNYGDLTAFMDAVNKTGVGTLVHPYFGELEVVVNSVWGPHHSADRRRYAEVDVEFIQHEETPADLRLTTSVSNSGRAGNVSDGVASAASAAETRASTAVAQMATERQTLLGAGKYQA